MSAEAFILKYRADFIEPGHYVEVYREHSEIDGEHYAFQVVLYDAAGSWLEATPYKTWSDVMIGCNADLANEPDAAVE